MWSGNSSPRYIPNRNFICSSKDFYKNTALLFIMASHWEQQKCLSAKMVTLLHLFLDKLQCSHMMKYYTKNENEWTAVVCDNMDESQNIILSKKSQTQKSTRCRVLLKRFKTAHLVKLVYDVRSQDSDYFLMDKGAKRGP